MIIPTRSYDDWTKEAVASCLNQSTAPAEVLVVHHGGEARESQTKHGGTLVRHVNSPDGGGVSTPLNHGLHLASTEYIARLDCDDRMLPQRIETQLEYMRRRPEVAVCATAVELINSSGKPLQSDPRRPGSPSGLLAREVTRTLLTRNVITHSSTLYRTTTVLEVGGYNPACIRMQDYELWMTLIGLGEFRTLPATLTQYRLHDRQVSRGDVPKESLRELTIARRVAHVRMGRSLAEADLKQKAWEFALRSGAVGRPGGSALGRFLGSQS